jgi:hypothetical protein
MRAATALPRTTSSTRRSQSRSAHHLVSAYTSLVAVDVTPTAPAGITAHKTAMPGNLPKALVYESFYGGVPQTATPATLEFCSARCCSPPPRSLTRCSTATAGVLSGMSARRCARCTPRFARRAHMLSTMLPPRAGRTLRPQAVTRFAFRLDACAVATRACRQGYAAR